MGGEQGNVCATWMHNSVDSVNVVPQHETCHGVGWKRESLVRAIQGPWKPFIHFVSTFCWLYHAILCWRSTGRINRHFTMVYHLWRFISTDGQQVFLGSSTHNAQVQRQLLPLSRATKTSVFFHGSDTTVVLRARNMGDAPGIVQARKSDVPESTNGTVWKNSWSTNPLRSKQV